MADGSSDGGGGGSDLCDSGGSGNEVRSLYFADQLNKIAFAAAFSLTPERCRPKEWNGMD